MVLVQLYRGGVLFDVRVSVCVRTWGITSMQFLVCCNLQDAVTAACWMSWCRRQEILQSRAKRAVGRLADSEALSVRFRD
jgi:hypothetical protein